MNKKLRGFLRDLESLEEKYGLHISGCGCCGSPSIYKTNGAMVADMLEFDEEDLEYTVDVRTPAVLKEDEDYEKDNYFWEKRLKEADVPEILRD